MLQAGFVSTTRRVSINFIILVKKTLAYEKRLIEIASTGHIQLKRERDVFWSDWWFGSGRRGRLDTQNTTRRMS